MSYLSCSVPFTLNQKKLICTGTHTLTSNPFHASNTEYYATCSKPFVVFDAHLKCNNTFKTKNDLNFNDGHYLFQLDSHINGLGFILQPTNLKNITVLKTETESTEFSAEDYSSLISLALPSLVLAFSFSFIYRQIINKR